MAEITKTAIVDTLHHFVTEMDELRAKEEQVDADIRSGKYDARYITTELIPQRDMLRRQMDRCANDAHRAGMELVDQYVAQAKDEDRLHAEDLTDDMFLLNQSGITLTVEDLRGMFARHEGNRTMQQLVLRYGREHGYDMRLAYDSATEAAEKIAGQIKYTIRTWVDHYLRTDRADEMLKKLFDLT